MTKLLDDYNQILDNYKNFDRLDAETFLFFNDVEAANEFSFSELPMDVFIALHQEVYCRVSSSDLGYDFTHHYDYILEALRELSLDGIENADFYKQALRNLR